METPIRSGARSPVEELARQVERGSMFTQAVLQKTATKACATEEMLHELVDLLADKGIVEAAELPAVATSMAEAAARAERSEAEKEAPAMRLRWPGIALRVDAEDPPDLEPVDCGVRLPICKAVCCKLKFALSSDEVEAGVVKWDIGHPYVIRQDSTGYCCHNDSETGGCSVYADRPMLCQRYSCRYDTRIWKDFDNMVLNQEWIDGHVGKPDAILIEELPSASDLAPSFS